MKLSKSLRGFFFTIVILALAGCGGGGGGGTAGGTPEVKMGGAIQGKPLVLANEVSVLAGTAGSADGVGAAARFNAPNDIVTDGTNLYLADSGNSTIRKIIIATGATSTLAGKAGFTGSADGTGGTVRFNNPSFLAITPDKTTLYVSDSGNNTIRTVNISTGVVTTLAGTVGSPGSANGIGSSARFSYPTGIATDGTNIYVADSINNTIRQIVIVSQAVSTLAGSGAPGLVDGVGSAASFSSPNGITTDGTNLYLTDSGNSAIRKIVIASGVVSTLVEPSSNSFITPAGITTDGTNLFIADTALNVVRRVVIATQAVSTLAGDGAGGTPGSIDAIGGAARFDAPAGMTISGSDLYITDSGSNIIRKLVLSTAAVTTMAGTPGSADGTGASAGFKSPYDICTDSTNLYVADAGSSTIRKIAIASGTVTTLSGTADVAGTTDGIGAAARFNFPSSITTDGTSLYVADTGNHTIRKIVIATGEVSTLAGTAGIAGAADGSGGAAKFNYPGGITTDGVNLYVSDTGNDSIRKIIIATGAVSTLVNSSAGLISPYGITTDGSSLYVADAGNNIIRKVVIATGAASALRVSGATFNFPTGITTDGTSLYLADSGNKSIGKILIATGAATTISADFNNPNGITTDGNNLFVADADANMIARIR